MFRLLGRLLQYALLSFLLAAGVFATTGSFRERWHGFVAEKLASHGVYLDFKSLTINPFGGLVAKQVRVFNDATRRHLIAAVDRLDLDVDLGQLLGGDVKVTGVELQQTNVALPVDPEHPEQTVVNLANFTAKAILEGEHLHVRHAEGLLEGVQVSISGVLELPDRQAEPDSRSAMERLRFMREHRVKIQQGLDWLARFKSPQAPSLIVKVSGSLERPQEIQASLLLEARNLAFEDHVWQELVAEADYDGGFIDLKRLHLRDHLGLFEATATWRIGADQVRFRLNSSADLPGLAQAFFNADQLREVVFYEAPQLAIEGRLFVGDTGADDFVPAEVTGRLECGRFGSRGEIFNSLRLNFGATRDGLFVREAKLRHKTGTLGLDLMNHRLEGFRYDLLLRMDPNVFLPFIDLPETREVIQRFRFDDSSSIDVHLACAGPSPRLHECPASGHGHLRNFHYKDVFFEEVEMDLALLGDIQNYSNVRARRPDGPAEAELVFVNDADDAKWLRLFNVRTEADTAGIVRAFNPKTAEAIARYRFSAGTETLINGTIAYKNNSNLNDFQVSFRNPLGSAHYLLWDEDRPISAPNGKIQVKGDVLSFDVKGRLYGDTLDVNGSVNLANGVSRYDAHARAGRFPYEVFGEQLFFENVDAKIRSNAGDTRFNISGSVLGGEMSLVGALDENRLPNPYEGELRISSMSFQCFAEVYSPGDESIGDITGHFKFAGRMNDWRTLKGGGALIIVNGNLLALPVLGPLTPLIGALLPARIKGYNVAKKADCTFEVSDGFIVTKNIEAESSAFRIKSSGNIDFLRDDIDFNAEVRIRGLTGIVLLPVTTLLAYKGSGTIGDTRWSPRIFGGGNKDERKPPTEMELREAQEIGGNPGRPAPAAPPRRKPLFGK